MDALEWLQRGFASPAWLVLIVAAVLLPRRRDGLFQAAALILLAVALAGPRLPGGPSMPAIIVDVSDSARDATMTAAEDTLAVSNLDGVALWLAAGAASEVERLDARVARDLEPGRSDLLRAVTQARSAGAERILLVSDGIDTRHVDVVDALGPIRDVTIDVLPVAPRANVRVERIDVPSRLDPGETFTATASIEAQGAEIVTVTLERDGERVGSERLEVRGGVAEAQWRLRAPESGDAALTVTVAADTLPADADDALVTTLRVEEQQPVIVMGDEALANLLVQAGVPVDMRAPASLTLPIDAPALVVRAPVLDFTAPQLEAIRSYVEAGGGLLMTGGANTFGLGGWYRTPVEDVLPVHTDLRSDVEVPLVAMMMVIDTSRSMETGSPSKLGLAQRGVAEVIELSFERDLLGLIAFSDASRVVFPLRAATSRGKREMLQATTSLQSAGGTVLEPALRDAIAALEASDAAVKHAIVLSDGRLYEGSNRPAPVGALETMAAVAREAGITVSTIAVGGEADADTLASLAVAGGGRFYEALDVSTLPRIFASEAVTATRSLVREDPGRPDVLDHPLLRGIPAPPGPGAYVATRSKATAEVLWGYPREESLLSLHRFGLGRTAAFTSDVSQWLGDLAAWPPLADVLVGTVRWLAARPDRFASSVTPDPLGASGGRLEVTAVEEGAFLDGLALTVVGAGRTVPLEGVGPGRYAATLPPELAGVPLVVVEGTEVVSRARFVTQDPEFRSVDGAATLARLAAVTGGRVLERGDAWVPPARDEVNVVRGPFALAALVAMLAAWTYRRFARRGTV